MQRQHLLIDADDTLWENNIYFEQAVHSFIRFLDHSSLTPAEVRAVINEIEHEMGYGTANFIRSLQETYRRLAEHEVRDEDLLRIREFGEQIKGHPLQLLPGVKETLDYLVSRHMLMIVTKGDDEEQQLKVDSSGLADYFQHVIVVREKDVAAYRTLVDKFEMDVAKTWMVGNSPRSDINPALAAGINAVFVPHAHTWDLELQDIRHVGDGRLLTLNNFSELCEYF